VNLSRLEYAGGLHDPLSAVVFCSPVKVDYTVVGGKFVVKNGQLVTMDVRRLVERHNRAAKRLLNGSI
jgi:8-oxoguanine deaminase